MAALESSLVRMDRHMQGLGGQIRTSRHLVRVGGGSQRTVGTHTLTAQQPPSLIVPLALFLPLARKCPLTKA